MDNWIFDSADIARLSHGISFINCAFVHKTESAKLGVCIDMPENLSDVTVGEIEKLAREELRKLLSAS